MKDWWENLSPREQYTALAGGIIVGIMIIYFYLWSPLLSKITNLHQQVAYQQQLLVMMQDARTQLQGNQGAHSRQNIDNSALLSIVADKLKQGNLAHYPHQLAQLQDGEIRLKFKQVAFDPFIGFLVSLWLDYVFNIEQLEVTPLPDQGTVQLMISIKA